MKFPNIYPIFHRFLCLTGWIAFLLLYGQNGRSDHTPPVLTELESSSLQAIKSVCSHPELVKQMEGHYLQEKPHWAKLFPDAKQARAAYTSLNRRIFQQKLRKTFIQESFKHEKGLLPMISHDLKPANDWKCPQVEKDNYADFLDLNGEFEAIQTLRSDLLQSHTYIWQEQFPLLLAAIYESQFIEKVLKQKRWRGPPYWPQNSKSIDYLPRLYPVASGSPQSQDPELRLLKIYQDFPILRRPSPFSRHGIHGENLSAFLFRLAFVEKHHRWLPNAIARTLSLHAKPHLEGLRLSLKQFKNLQKYVQLVQGEDIEVSISGNQRRNLLTLSLFLRSSLPDVIRTQVASLHETSQIDKTYKVITRHVRQEAKTWHKELIAARKRACEGEVTFVETLPGLVPLYLAHHHHEDNLKYMDSLCRSRWGQTFHRVAEASASIGSSLIFLTTVSLGPAIPSFLPLSASLVGSSYISRAMRMTQTLALESAILNPSIRHRNGRKTDILSKVLLTPLSAAAALGVGNTLRLNGAWQFFVPFVGPSWNTKRSTYYAVDLATTMYLNADTRQKRGVNVFEDRGFYILNMTMIVSKLASSRLIMSKGILEFFSWMGIDIGVEYAIGYFVQNGFYLLEGKEPDPRLTRWALELQTKLTLQQKIAYQGLQNFLEWSLGKRFPGGKAVIVGTLAFLRRVFMSLLGSNAYIEFMSHKDIDLYQAIARIEPEHMIPSPLYPLLPEDRRPERNHEKKLDRNKSALKAMVRLLTAYKAHEEPGLDAYLQLHKTTHAAMKDIQDSSE